MKWVARSQDSKNLKFEIQYDPQAGYYLYIYRDGNCIRDYLEDSLLIAKECAYEEYGLSKNAWIKKL